MSSAQGYSIHICELHICSFKQPKSKSIPQTLHLAWRGDTYTCLSSTEQLTTVKRITSLQAILNYIETLSQKQNEMKNNKRWGETLHCYQKKYSSFLLFPKQYRISTLQLAVTLHWEMILKHTRGCPYLYANIVIFYKGLRHRWILVFLRSCQTSPMHTEGWQYEEGFTDKRAFGYNSEQKRGSRPYRHLKESF